MTDERRDGAHPNAFSREIRATHGGGTIPPEWECKVVDLDRLFVAIGDELLRVNLEGRFFVWYRDPPVEPVALAELKMPGDPQRSWAVTQALARRADIAGFRVERQADGSLRVQDLDHRTTRYGRTRDFVEAEIRPLIPLCEDPF